MEVQRKSIEQLKEYSEVTANTHKELLEQAAARDKQYRALSAKLNELKEFNEEVKNYLSISVPPDVSKLLNSARSRKALTTDPSSISISESHKLRGNTP